MQVPSVTVEQMREVDRLMVEEYGITVPQMMENAGRILAELVVERYGPDSVVVLAGKGNNGGGGLVAARYLHNKGVRVTVVPSNGDLGELPMRHMSTLSALDVTVQDYVGHDFDVVVDALLGYNAMGPPRGKVAELVSEALVSRRPVASLDVPTGFDLESGTFHPISFRHTGCTLTLGLPKENMAGTLKELWLADIGIPREVYSRLGIEVPVLFAFTDRLEL